MPRIRKEQLSRNHHRAGFDCGVEELNTFIRNTARRQDERHLVRTTVLVDVDRPERILAYYSTAPCEIAPPPGVPAWRNDPHPVPFLRMARLASDLSVRGRGFGELALLAAIEDAATISRGFTAIGGLVVDAKDQHAAVFYERFGFVRIEKAGLQLFMPIQDCVSLMDEPGA
ncbi:GNAT family N-acetyltransferase [Thioalkalivibrio nitratireducens]|uniref:GNAT family N-acetyltransferase n=1 Tax=Thioalkalivibrio nitratireducens TaxID=186931 RepID=UPI0005C1FCB8|nr:GNAT family N-acetyltransferase [Thioalkalivibrio nitratireducens]